MSVERFRRAIEMIRAQECECSENHGFIPACPHVIALSALSFSDQDWADFAQSAAYAERVGAKFPDSGRPVHTPTFHPCGVCEITFDYCRCGSGPKVPK